MNPEPFDPFSKRLARDIRNSLSRAFIKSLVQHDPRILQNLSDNLVSQELPSTCKDYIRDRMARYAAARATIAQDKITGQVEQSQVLWELKLYYEMHELLEDIWRQSTGARRKALQGLIRAAGMKIHAEQGNNRAASSMARKAIADLQENRSALPDFEPLDKLFGEANKMALLVTD